MELFENDEVGDGGGEHAVEGGSPDLEHPTAVDGLRVVNVVHTALSISGRTEIISQRLLCERFISGSRGAVK